MNKYIKKDGTIDYGKSRTQIVFSVLRPGQRRKWFYDPYVDYNEYGEGELVYRGIVWPDGYVVLLNKEGYTRGQIHD